MHNMAAKVLGDKLARQMQGAPTGFDVGKFAGNGEEIVSSKEAMYCQRIDQCSAGSSSATGAFSN